MRKSNLQHNRCNRRPGSYRDIATAKACNSSYDTDEETRMQPQPLHPADVFSQLAYRCVDNGIVRLDHRRQLARAAVRLGLRPFEAQLLIACAIRQKTLEQGPQFCHRPPAPDQATLDPPRPQRFSPWKTLALLAATAASLDILLIYLWLS
jgi:hypothetical protein